jgi:hypothetical protein
MRAGFETNASFSHALDCEEKRIEENWESIWHHKRLGFYYDQLQPYYKTFSREQIHVYLFEDLQRNSNDLLRSIFGFLSVDETFKPNTSEKPNVSGIPKSKWLQKILIKTDDPVKNCIKRFFPHDLRRVLVKRMKRMNLKKPSIPNDIRNELTNIYREDILKLQDLIDRDLSHWLK